MKNFKILIFIILLILILIVVFQNTENATFKFLFWETNMPRALFYIIIFLTGVFIGWIGTILRKK